MHLGPEGLGHAPGLVPCQAGLPCRPQARGHRAGELARGGFAVPRSLHLDIGGPDHLAPLLGIVGDELAEVGR
jgi:hypothetical protein